MKQTGAQGKGAAAAMMREKNCAPPLFLADTGALFLHTRTAMTAPHKNKTLACLLAFALGAVGAHRFYLGGGKDRWGWLHAASLPASLLIALTAPQANGFYKILPLIVSALAGCLEALVLGLTPDERWDAAYNGASARRSDSQWPLALLLVATLMTGGVILIAAIARLFDLLYTGGAYG
jgi:TM2 domain-containing membrane protein YozV